VIIHVELRGDELIEIANDATHHEVYEAHEEFVKYFALLNFVLLCSEILTANLTRHALQSKGDQPVVSTGSPSRACRGITPAFAPSRLGGKYSDSLVSALLRWALRGEHLLFSIV